MARPPKKVTLGYIADDSTRRSRYKKRLRGLMKKAGEMATLCNVKTCVVVYGEGEAAPEVFPSPDKAVGILNGFNSMPELGHCKQTMDQEGFLTQRIAKLQEQVDKSRRECRDREIRYLLQQIMDGNLPGLVRLSMEQLVGVSYKVDELLKTMGERMGKTHSQAPPPAPCVTTGTGSIDMGSPALHQAPARQQEGTLLSSGGDLGTLVYGDYAGGHEGAGFTSGDTMMQMESFNLEFGWSHFPPM